MASVDLVMAPPTTTMPAPAATAAAAVSQLMPPAALTGIDDGLGHGAQRGERRLAAHLLVDRGVDADVVGAPAPAAWRARATGSATSIMSTISLQP